MGPYATQFIKLVKELRLDDRNPEIDSMVKQIEMGLIPENVIKTCIPCLEPEIEKQKRCFNPLGKAPTQEELGKFDIEIGTLIEREGVRIGIRFMDRPRHMIAAGATGSGKTNLLRVTIHGLGKIKRNLDTA